MKRTCLPIAALLGCAILSVLPAAAETFLAVGLPSPDLEHHGVVYGYAPTQDQALNICRGIDKTNNTIPLRASEAQKACAIVADFGNKCLAVSVNGDQTTPATGFAWATADKLSDAQAQTVAGCEAMAGTAPHRACVVQLYTCDGSATGRTGPAPAR